LIPELSLISLNPILSIYDFGIIASFEEWIVLWVQFWIDDFPSMSACLTRPPDRESSCILLGVETCNFRFLGLVVTSGSGRLSARLLSIPGKAILGFILEFILGFLLIHLRVKLLQIWLIFRRLESQYRLSSFRRRRMCGYASAHRISI
jgi:hypothetical protein